MIPNAKEVAREIARYHKHNLKDGNAEGLAYDIENAILSERTTAYKAGLERAAEIVELRSLYTIAPDDMSRLAKAIRSEAQGRESEKVSNEDR